jgi:hypothetical protein
MSSLKFVQGNVDDPTKSTTSAIDSLTDKQPEVSTTTTPYEETQKQLDSLVSIKRPDGTDYTWDNLEALDKQLETDLERVRDWDYEAEADRAYKEEALLKEKGEWDYLNEKGNTDFGTPNSSKDPFVQKQYQISDQIESLFVSKIRNRAYNFREGKNPQEVLDTLKYVRTILLNTMQSEDYDLHKIIPALTKDINRFDINNPSTPALDKYVDDHEYKIHGFNYDEYKDDLALNHLMSKNQSNPSSSTTSSISEVNTDQDTKIPSITELVVDDIAKPAIQASNPVNPQPVNTVITPDSYKIDYNNENWDRDIHEQVKTDIADGAVSKEDLFRSTVDDFLSTEVTEANLDEKQWSLGKSWVILDALLENPAKKGTLDEQVVLLKKNIQAISDALSEDRPNIPYANNAIKAIKKNVEAGKGISGHIVDTIFDRTPSKEEMVQSIRTDTSEIPEVTKDVSTNIVNQSLSDLIIDTVKKDELPEEMVTDVPSTSTGMELQQDTLKLVDPFPVSDIPPVEAPRSASLSDIPISSLDTEVPLWKNRTAQVGAGLGVGAVGLAFLNNYLQQKEQEKREKEKRDRLRQMVTGSR